MLSLKIPYIKFIKNISEPARASFLFHYAVHHGKIIDSKFLFSCHICDNNVSFNDDKK